MNNVSSPRRKHLLKRIIFAGTMIVSMSSTPAHAFDVATLITGTVSAASVFTVSLLVSRLRAISESSQDNKTDGRERNAETSSSSSTIELTPIVPGTTKPYIESNPRKGELETLAHLGLTRCPSNLY